MTFYSHIRKDDSGDFVSKRTLKEHIGAMRKYVQMVAKPLAQFEDDYLNVLSLADRIVFFHDFGKFTSFFQQYLHGEDSDRDLRRHSATGAIMAYNEFVTKNQKHALLALYIISRHHANLNDVQNSARAFLDDHLQRIFEKHKSDLTRHIDAIEEHVDESGLDRVLKYPDPSEVRKGFKYWIKKNASIGDYYLMNYLFSLLIEADKLDASDTKPFFPNPISPECVDERFGLSAPAKNLELDKLTGHELRNFCRAEVVSMLEKNDILTHKIFTLTAPTGIGKTMTALDFALKLKEKIRKDSGFDTQIIYALPFINIIEQAWDEYQKTLPPDVNILAHYQLADVFGKDDVATVQGKDSTEKYNKKVMLMDTWQSDVVITSFVQFFETLIGYRNKLLKKFNHLSNSIVILDEVQTLRLDQMPLIGAALFYLARYLNTRIVLMTATRPKIFELAQSEILSNEKERVEPLELLPSHKNVFAVFHRTRIVPLLKEKANSPEGIIDHFVHDLFAVHWTPERSCLIVCNTVNRSIQLYYALVEYFEEQQFNNPVEYLSTNIVPLHRYQRIGTIKRQLERGEAPLVIATQVVEAGVDLDFDMGFRDLGPIDSVIQVAGRINRNNHPGKEYSPLYIVDFGDGKKVYGQITIIQAEKALSQKQFFPEEEYFYLVDQYFDDISSRSSFSRYNKIFESMKQLRYDSENKEEDRPVSAFRIIEEKSYNKAVFIELNEEAAMIRQEYLKKITGELSKAEFDKNYKNSFQQHIITVPGYLSKNLSHINDYD
ncbi:MAG: CRISPR-associated helicase Cas3', partial [Bacteroidota bacterium]